MLSWNRYFFNLVEAIALKSKDESSKIGAVIVGPDKEIRATGYNGFPRGVKDTVRERHERPLKYKYTEHAERNAIYNAARHGASVNGCTLYCHWPPCSDCARAIVQAGIKRVYTIYSFKDCPERWHEDMKISKEILKEGKVIIRSIGKGKYEEV